MLHKQTQPEPTDNSPLTIRDILPWMGAMVILITLPYLMVWQSMQPDKQFLGALVNPYDASVYLSAMRQGADGRFLFHFTFSPEPISPQPIYSLYLLMGRWVAWINGSIMLWFHIFRVLASLITMLGLLFFVRKALPHNGRLQRTAWLFAMFAGGVGWLAVIFSQNELKNIPDLSRSGWGMLLPMLGTPHFALGLGLELFLFGSVLRMGQKQHGYRWAFTGAAAAAGIGLVYPYLVSVIGLVLGLYLLALAVQQRRIPYRLWLKGGIVIAPLLPPLYYFGVRAQQDPAWKLTHVQNNVIVPPTPLLIAVGFGILGLFALLGLPKWLRDHRSPLIPIWAITNVLVIYFPVPFSGRFILGLTVPMVTLAALGVEAVALPWWQKQTAFKTFGRLTPTPYDTTRRLIFILTLPSVLIITLLLIQSPRYRPDTPLYMAKTEINAAEWFANEDNTDSLLLVAFPVGNYLPRITDKRVFMGQTFLTVNLEEKFDLLQTFWDEDTTDDWRESFLQEWGITHIYVGQYEREMINGQITVPGRLVYEQDGVSIYELLP